jgi:hypothetical protein
MLEAGPVAVALDFLRGMVEVEVDVARTLLFDPPLKRAIGCLVVAGVGVTLPGPAALLPIGNLAALDRN